MLAEIHESTLELICTYLTPSDCITLGQTCQRFLSLSHSPVFWPCVTLNNGLSGWSRLFDWHSKHLLEIQPFKLEIVIVNHTPLIEFKKIQSLLKGLKSVNEIFVWIGWGREEQVTSILNTIFDEMSITTLTTTVFVETPSLIAKMQKLERLYLIGQDIPFTGLCLARLPNLKAFVLKPHQLDFGELTKFILRSSKSIEELQVDCQNYPQQLFIQMMCALCPETLRKLRLYHLQNISEECFVNLSKVANLQQLIITKAHKITNEVCNSVFGKISWQFLVKLDITESRFIEDGPVIQLVKKSPRLKSVKLAWCEKLTSFAIEFIISRCLGIEELVVTGIKQLFDHAFPEIKKLVPIFKREQYLDLKHSSTSLSGFDPNTLFTQPNALSRITCLRQLTLLDCVRCDCISNEIYEILSLLRPTATILDYYSNRVGLRVRDEFDY